MYRRGRFWYGYHPNEEVVRVPLGVLTAGSPWTDPRVFATPDLTHSVLDFFGLAGEKGSPARSVFRQGRHDFATSLTLRRDRHKEWFLVVRQGATKYRMNLHPQGDGEARVSELRNFEESLLRRDRGVPAELTGMVRPALRRYGVAPEEVHSLFRWDREAFQ